MEVHGAERGERSGSRPAVIFEALGRWAVSAATLAALGVVGLRWLESRARGRRDAAMPSFDRALGSLGLASSLLLLAALASRAVFQSIQAFGLGDGLSAESLRLVALESRWGSRWRWQVLGASAAATGFLGPALGMTRLWPLAEAATLGLAGVLPMTGHAYGHPLAWVAQSVHILGMGFWLGTLVTAVTVPARVLGLAKATDPATLRLPWLRAFAPIASTGAALTVLTGCVLAISYLPAWSSLWRTTYGRVLLVKLTFVVAIVLLGAFNYRRLRSRAADDRSSIPRTVAVETVLAVLTVVVAGLLSSLPIH